MTDNLGKVTRTGPHCCRRHALRYTEVSKDELAALPEQCPRARANGELGRIDVGEPVVRLTSKPRAESSVPRRLLITAVIGAAAIGVLIALVEIGAIEVAIR